MAEQAQSVASFLGDESIVIAELAYAEGAWRSVASRRDFAAYNTPPDRRRPSRAVPQQACRTVGQRRLQVVRRRLTLENLDEPGLNRTIARRAPSSILSITSCLILLAISRKMRSNITSQPSLAASALSIGRSGHSISVSRVERKATSARISSFHPETIFRSRHD